MSSVTIWRCIPFDRNSWNWRSCPVSRNWMSCPVSRNWMSCPVSRNTCQMSSNWNHPGLPIKRKLFDFAGVFGTLPLLPIVTFKNRKKRWNLLGFFEKLKCSWISAGVPLNVDKNQMVTLAISDMKAYHTTKQNDRAMGYASNINIVWIILLPEDWNIYTKTGAILGTTME